MKASTSVTSTEINTPLFNLTLALRLTHEKSSCTFEGRESRGRGGEGRRNPDSKRRGTNESEMSVGFAITDEPDPDDEEFEQEGLRIFVEDALVEPLDGLTLDVRVDDDGTELVFR